MSWYASEIEFQRELRSRDGETAKVWLRPWSGGDRMRLQNRAQEIDEAGTLGDFKRDQILTSLIRWELPDAPDADGLARLDTFVYEQLEELVSDINSAADAAALPASEEAADSPLPDSNAESVQQLVSTGAGSD